MQYSAGTDLSLSRESEGPCAGALTSCTGLSPSSEQVCSHAAIYYSAHMREIHSNLLFNPPNPYNMRTVQRYIDPSCTVDPNMNIVYPKMNIIRNAAIILITHNKQQYKCVYHRQHGTSLDSWRLAKTTRD